MVEKNFYDKYYYLTSCGMPYDNVETWEAFFGGIADRIVKDINPKTVLDAGCAYGYLVAALRDRGVEAYGIDISEYAISQVRNDIKPYCKIASILSPLERTYDLVICIEVVEHLPAQDSRTAIENLCKYTSDFIFTSTPTDFKEASHFNVQPTEYWARLFAVCDFFRDTDFDASFIITHAIRFRKRNYSIPEIAANYEKIFYRNFIENKTLRNELITLRTSLANRFDENESSLLDEKNQIINERDDHINNLNTEIQNKASNLDEVNKIVNVKDEFTGYLEGEIRQKDETLKILAEQIKQLSLFSDNLNKSLLNKDEEIKLLKEKIQNLHATINIEKNEYLQILNELRNFNEELRYKLTSSYNDRNSRDRLINDLNMQLDNLKNESQLALGQNKYALKEFDRIKNLKGYKFLMWYYKVRDQLLMRTSRTDARQKDAMESVLSIADASQSIIEKPLDPTTVGETILNIERRYYSQNPIYNIDFKYAPLISVVVPVYNTPINILSEMIESVLFQTYQYVELYIINASPDNSLIAECISKYMAKDDRIISINVENKGIAENTNAGIRLAKGEFIAFLDHDDIITPNALFEVVSRLQDDIGDYDFFYSDKDMMLEDGRTNLHPLYKPQWSPETMFSANYLTHFCVIRKNLIEKAGFLDSKTDGSQDWDIFLKVSRLTDKICHIPEKLYHWRIIPTSVASGIGAKPYALKAQLLSVQNHFTALNYDATIKFHDTEKHVLKVEWNNIPVKLVSFIINHTGSENQLFTLLEQIDDYKRTLDYEVEQIVLLYTDTEFDNKFQNLQCIKNDAEDIYGNFNKAIDIAKGEILIFLTSQIHFADAQSIGELKDWAAQKQYGAVMPKIIGTNRMILSTGIVINGDYILDFHKNTEFIHYSCFGSSEWYRNITAVRMECFAIKSELLKQAGRFNTSYREFMCIELCLRLSKSGYRQIYNPFAVAQTDTLADMNSDVYKRNFSDLKKEYEIKECDKYWNKNLQNNNPIPTENKRKVNKITAGQSGPPPITGWEKYSSDAISIAHNYDFSIEDLKKNLSVLNANPGKLNIKSVNWFLPPFEYIYYAGLYTVFRLANHIQTQKNVQNTFVIVGGSQEMEIYDKIVEAFPGLKGCKVLFIYSSAKVNEVPYADASVCSFWTTAYYLLRFNRTKRKFYFIQDFEPLFYPAGSTYGQTEATYKFNFYGITNTKAIKEFYEDEYGTKAIALKPCIDTKVFYPKEIYFKDSKFRVFFYGRPGHPRNGFELGSVALKILKSKFKDRVEIYCAGSDWNPEDYDLGGIVTNIGRMDFEKTADLYRVCDVGLVMMFTKHPSYLPFELMACGCAVVSNYNNDTKWFLKENINCLLVEAAATRIAETIEKLLLNAKLRNELVENALLGIKNNHTSWSIELNAIYDFMCTLENSKSEIKEVTALN